MPGQIAGNQRAERSPRDFYPTHPAWTRALLDNELLTGGVWEPACGDGAMVQVLEEYGYDVRATDIENGTDFLESTETADTIITNPPASLLDEFILDGLEKANHTLAILCGWHFLAGGLTRSKRIWSRTPPNKALAVANRMPLPGGTSQFNHVWCLWDVENLANHTDLTWVRAHV